MADVRVHVVAAGSALLADGSLSEDVDRLGVLSAKGAHGFVAFHEQAQGLSRSITSTALFSAELAIKEQQKLFVASDSSSGETLGYIKTGTKHLFYLDRKGVFSEMDPLCVLDFYVHERLQRRGVGLTLFNAMLEAYDGATPASIAYDRPSPLLYAFLRKHAALAEFFPQPNNFVVFNDYFLVSHE